MRIPFVFVELMLYPVSMVNIPVYYQNPKWRQKSVEARSCDSVARSCTWCAKLL